MKIVKISAHILVVLLVVLVIAAPIGPLPGFFIGGEESEAPTSWPDTSQIHEVKLKVPGTIPRVVIIWVVESDGELFVVGNHSSGWVEMLGSGSPVSLRIEDKTYQLVATQMQTGWEPVMQKYVDKYRPDYPDIVAGFPSIEEAKGKIAVYRLRS